jgi:membrane protease YdiL (CAAX protease family)
MGTTIDCNFRIKYIIKSVLFCIVFTALLVVFSFAKNFVPDNFERIAHGIIGTLAAFLATVLFLKFDRKRFSDIGLTFQRTTITKFFTGVVVGIVIMGLLATSVIYFTDVVIVANQKSIFLNFLLMTLPLIPLAFMEELGFRAYPLEILKDKVGIRLAIIITSILFALYHIVNGWTIASSFYGPGIWGLIFGLAAIYSKGIAMPTGIHYAANLTSSAFGDKNITASIWTVKQPDNAVVKHGGIDWITILPGLALLVFAVVCIELYMRRKAAVNDALAKKLQ